MPDISLVDGFYIDKTTGLSLPFGMKQIKASPNPISPAQRGGGHVTQDASGTHMAHDPDYGIPKWPNYGSGFDDMLNRAIAAGTMANGGMTPVLSTMVTTIVSKLQMTASTWIMSLRGKKSPLSKALDIISSADDADGSHTFVRAVIGTMLVDNRGVFISYAPIGRINFDNWGEYGFETIPLVAGNEKFRVLTMSTATIRGTRGVWTLDGMECSPTGVPEFPYWIRKKSNKDGWIWVLVPREFGTQIVQQVGAKANIYAGLGTSNVWACSPYVAKGVVYDRMDWESVSSRPMEGIVYGSGLDTPDQLHEQYKAFKTTQEEEGNLLFKGVLFAGTVNENSKITVIPWSAPPPGYDPDKWDDQVAQAISGAFHVSPVHVRAALVGSGPAIETLMGALEGETSLAYARNVLENLLNLATPPRVYIKLIPKSDSQLHKQSETFAVFALGLTRVQKQFGVTNEQVFSTEEVRALVEQEIGIKIPDTSGGTETADTRDDVEDIAASYVPTGNLVAITATNVDSFAAAGDVLTDIDGRLFLSTGQRTGSFLWCSPAVGYGQWLLDINTLYGIPRSAAAPDLPQVKKNETGITLKPRSLVTAFSPGGTPLPEPTYDDVEVEDWAEVEDAAAELWLELAEGRDFQDLFENWDWDEDAHSWIHPDTGLPLTASELAEIRNELIAVGGVAEHDDEGSLINQLIVGAILLGLWESLFRTRLLYFHFMLYALGNGAVIRQGSGPNDDDQIVIQNEMLRQYIFLNGFSRAMHNGDTSEASARNRASQYYDGASGTLDRGRAASFDYEMRFPCYPGDCSSECCARCGCYWDSALVGGVIESTWHRTKIESCPTCLSREDCPPLTFNQETGEYENWDCYGGEELEVQDATTEDEDVRTT